MSAIKIGTNAIFGARAPLPAKGFPEGRLRWRIRNSDFVRAFVKTPIGIRHFTVFEKDGYWTPGWEQGRNETAKP